MKSAIREVGFSLLAWLIPFAVSVCIFPLKSSHPPLFESLMGPTLAASTVLLGCLDLRWVREGFVAHGARIGIQWAVANWLLDGLMFSNGPMKMDFDQYVMDIGTGYLTVPIITIGLAIAANCGRRAADQRGG